MTYSVLNAQSYHLIDFLGKVNPCERPEFQVENNPRELVNPFSIENAMADDEHHGHHLDEDSGLFISDLSQCLNCFSYFFLHKQLRIPYCKLCTL